MAGSPLEQDDDEVVAQINVVPFVDIVLVLLIIFLLTASVIARASIPVDLPRAANASQVVDATLNIVITAAGDLFLDGKSVTPAALADAVRSRSLADPKLRAVIAGDKAVRYEHVVHVIDILKQSGVNAFALNIERGAP